MSKCKCGHSDERHYQGSCLMDRCPCTKPDLDQAAIIERLKNNERAFHFLTHEEKRAFISCALDDVLELNGNSGFLPSSNEGFILAKTYRLRPDYQPEPEKPKMGWVEHGFCVYKITGSEMSVYQVKLGQTTWDMHQLQSHKGFGGIKYKDCAHSRLKQAQMEGFEMVMPSPCRDCGPFEPVAARLWREKK